MKNVRDFLYGRNLYLWISGIISFLLFLILYGLSEWFASGLDSQQMASRWSEEKDVAQISCFFSSEAGMDTDRIEMFRHNLDTALLEASIVQDSPNASARLWVDAFSASGKVGISSDRTTLSADAIGVGGDFFLFHPFKLLDGGYFSESDLNQDYCILDEDAAWQLFGSNDVAGMTVSIAGVPHIVSGVIRRDSGSLEEAAGLDGTVVYVSYTTLTIHGTSNGINHYEIVMPNPVKGYAKEYVGSHIGAAEDAVQIVENSTRYQLIERFGVIGAFGTRSMNRKPIIYPYWENVARGYEDIIALLTLFACLFLAYPVVLLVIFIGLCWKRKTWTARSIYRYLLDKWERKREEMWARKQRRKLYKDRFDDEEELL